VRAPRQGIPPTVWRIGGEVAFLVAVAVALGVAKLSWWAILLAMAGAFGIVCLLEWLASREQLTFARPAEPAPVHPVVEAQRAEDTDEQESLGWTAFEEAQEPSDAMTIIGAPAAEESAGPTPPEPEPEPEPELPPAAEEVATEGRRGWWRRRSADGLRVLPADDGPEAMDPWEQGFDAPVAAEAEEIGEPDEETEEPAAVVEEPARRRFRRR
jgi:hypothetical protein